MKASEVRVRFAPSPTGYLHVGGARTAVFNWLYARKRGGKFLLRIEDTDLARSGGEMVQAILDGLTWLGLNWDEEPVFQSQRFAIYQRQAKHLVSAGHAYFCYCSKEELGQERRLAETEGRTYRYSRRCRDLSAEQRLAFEADGRRSVVRFRVGPGKTRFVDRVHGEIVFENEEIDDFIILRSDGVPTYHLAVVVDDHAMGITHVIRGVDHLTNTPKQVLLYHAFGWPTPEFVHVPLILGPDKKRLSKRHGAASVGEYAEKGYLPQAVVNFIALLGWNPGDDREILSREELIAAFDISGIGKPSAVFDEKKLEWMNRAYIARTETDTLVELARPFFQKGFGWACSQYEERRSYLEEVIGLLRGRARRLSDFVDFGRYFFVEPHDYDTKGVRKHLSDADVPRRLEAVAEAFGKCETFDAQTVEHLLRSLAEGMGLKAAQLIHPVRLATTGFTVGPGLFELLAVLGKEVAVRRLRKVAQLLRAGQLKTRESAVGGSY